MTESHSDRLNDIIAACDKGDSRAMLSNILGGVTILSAAAAGFFYYKGYIATGSSSNARNMSKTSQTSSSLALSRTS